MRSRAGVLAVTLALVVAGCTSGSEDPDDDDPGPAAPPATVSVLESPGSTQVRRDLRAAVSDPDSLALPALPDNPVVGSQQSLNTHETRCIVSYGWDAPEEDCIYGDPAGEREIVLWGDEQAAQWLPALSAIAAETGRRLRLLAKYECPPLADLTPWLETELRVHTECRSFNDRALASIVESPPETVIVSGTIRGTAFLVDGQVVQMGTVLGKGRWSPLPGNREVWQGGLEASLAQLEDVDTSVVVLGEVPARDLDLGVCLWRNQDRLGRCAVQRDEVELVDHQRAVQEIAEVAGATYVDTTRWLCTRETCPAVVDDAVTYADSVLVSRQYSHRLSRVLGEETGLLPQERSSSE